MNRPENLAPVEAPAARRPLRGRAGWFQRWLLALIVWIVHTGLAQTTYLADGFHGGVYGHYPEWVTQFMVDQLARHPDWKLNLEIEPETWDWVRTNTPAAYAAFRALYNNPTNASRVEYTNPDYAQSYLWNISGESVIRQFSYGIRKLWEHFPQARFTTYASEEPCFTSALPGILKSFGFNYAVLKNPDTCWGGYTRAFGGELVNWVGPDGTSLPTVPRYASEDLAPGSTWQTTAWNNSSAYLKAAFAQGIAHPVGMSFQDAGWRNGPLLGTNGRSHYVTWTGYIENQAAGSAAPDWAFGQEDVLVSLVWGAQVLQKIAREVRGAENRIVTAEKLAALASVYRGAPWPAAAFDEAWRTLLLSQHHDCWIVPYNGGRNNTWADKVAGWTGRTLKTSDSLIRKSVAALSDKKGGLEAEGGSTNKAPATDDASFIRVFNTLANGRVDLASVLLPKDWKSPAARILNNSGEEVPSQIVAGSETNQWSVLFRAQVPSMGYSTYRLQKGAAQTARGAGVTTEPGGVVTLETDLFTIVLNQARGGTIESLKARTLGNREFVDRNGPRRFNEMRGCFYQEKQFHSSAENPAKLTVVENGPVRARVQINGQIGVHPFVQTITLVQGQPRIDFNLRIDWKGNPGIGAEYGQTEPWRQTDRRRAFYDSRFKLLALFPAKLESPKVFKNAPFDVTESRLADTTFNSWDEIKNDVILNWADLLDGSEKFGVALLTDHTTSYAHGADDPLGLTLQYSGIGLWGRDYRITGPSEINYALIPHAGRWDRAGVWTQSDQWNEPLVAEMVKTGPAGGDANESLIRIAGAGWEIPSAVIDTNGLSVRFFNAEGDSAPRQVTFGGKADRVELARLDGEVIQELPARMDAEGNTVVGLALPRFGVATVRFRDIRGIRGP
jgi:alpha-mannosidase